MSVCAILTEVQQFTRSVFVNWDGAVDTKAFAIMQQGLVINLLFEATTDEDEFKTAEEYAANKGVGLLAK